MLKNSRVVAEAKRMASIDVLSEITAFLKFKRSKSTPVDSADD